MSESRAILGAGLLIAAAVALAVAASQLRQKHNLAVTTVDDIEEQFAALDPVTKAAVVARLSRDVATAAYNQHASA
jgi:hypothetical protein